MSQTITIQQAINAVIERRDLSGVEMQSVMQQIMTGAATPAQIRRRAQYLRLFV